MGAAKMLQVGLCKPMGSSQEAGAGAGVLVVDVGGERVTSGAEEALEGGAHRDGAATASGGRNDC